MIEAPSASSTGSGCWRSSSPIGTAVRLSASRNSGVSTMLRADVEPGRADQQAEDIGDAPAPGDQLLMRQSCVVRAMPNSATMTEMMPVLAHCQLAAEALAVAAVLDQEGDGAAELAADRKPLQQPRERDDDRRGEADRRIARRHHHQDRADHHQRDRQGQPGLAAVRGRYRLPIDDRAQRPHHIGEAERAEGDQQRHGRVAGRERTLRRSSRRNSRRPGSRTIRAHCRSSRRSRPAEASVACRSGTGQCRVDRHHPRSPCYLRSVGIRPAQAGLGQQRQLHRDLAVIGVDQRDRVVAGEAGVAEARRQRVAARSRPSPGRARRSR